MSLASHIYLKKHHLPSWLQLFSSFLLSRRRLLADKSLLSSQLALFVAANCADFVLCRSVFSSIWNCSWSFPLDLRLGLGFFYSKHRSYSDITVLFTVQFLHLLSFSFGCTYILPWVCCFFLLLFLFCLCNGCEPSKWKDPCERVLRHCLCLLKQLNSELVPAVALF